MTPSTDTGGNVAGELAAELSALRQLVEEKETEVAVLRQTLAMRQSNADSTYRAVFNSINEAILIQDLNSGAVIDVNQAALAAWGFNRTELLDRTLVTLSVPQNASDFTPQGETWQRVMTGAEYRGTWRSTHKDGRPLAMEITLKRVRLTGHMRVLAVVTDISERTERERVIQAQAAQLLELSTPLIPVSDHVVVMPLIGVLDASRMAQVQQTLLTGVAAARAQVAILDITGVVEVNRQVAEALVQAARALRLIGSRVILTGIRWQLARTLVELDVELLDITTYSTLQSGIAAALGQPAGKTQPAPARAEKLP